MFRTIFDRAPEGIVLVDVNTKQILDANSMICGMLGYSHGEIIGLSVADIHPPGEREFIAEDFDRPKDQPDKAFSVRESPVIRKDGSILYADIKGVRLAIGGKKCLSVFFSDVTERKRAEEALLRNREELQRRVQERTLELSRSHEKYHTLFESATDGIFILDLEGHFLDANATGYRRLGYTKDEMLSMTISQLTPQEYAVRVADRFSEIKENNMAVFESAHTRKDGTPMPVEVNARVLDYEGEQVYFSIIRDITERKEADNRLRESEARFRGAFESAAVGASMASLNGRFIKVNRFLCDMLGYSQEELLSRTFSDVTHPDDIPIGLDAGKKLVSGEISHTMFEKRYMRKDGTLINVVISPTIIRDNYGSPLHFFALFQDITERKRAEYELKKALSELGMRVEERTRELSDMIEKLNLEIIERKRAEKTIEKSLKEKEVLLKEIHHRVKNNMAIISSLLSLQEARTDNKESKEILIDFQNRIKTLSLVHEKLLSSDDFGAIHLSDYITSLTSNVLSSFIDDETNIESTFEVEQVVLDMDRLIPFGLILNEIITNTIKHAFNKINQPKISIIVTRNKKHFTLTVKDNGNGIPEGVDILKSNALGGKIIKTLVRQLKGEMKVASGKKGTSIKIRCPI